MATLQLGKLPMAMVTWQFLDQLNGPAGQTSRTDQLDRPAGRISRTDQLDGPVFFILRLGQFAYSKIDLSVFTLSQLPSLKKTLFSTTSLYLHTEWFSLGTKEGIRKLYFAGKN